MNNMNNINAKLKKDPFIEKWRTNYNANYNSGIFSDSRTKPFVFLQNTKPYIGKPCILVAAGPSIDKNISILKNFQKNVIILAADVILYKLLEHDICPDFVVNIDPSDMFVRFWNDLETSAITLICPTSTHPDVLRAWRGQYVFFNQSDFSKSPKGKALREITKKTGGFGSVFNRFFIGATMLQIAKSLSLYPAILIGYDFAYTGGKAYCSGFLERKIYDDLFNPDTIEHEEQLKKLKKMEIKDELKMKDINGNFVETSKQLDFYRRNFLQLQQELNIPVINSTEGGTLLGVPCMKLQTSLEKFCSNEIDKTNIFEIKKRKRKRKR
jgi:hypothetical protein